MVEMIEDVYNLTTKKELYKLASTVGLVGFQAKYKNEDQTKMKNIISDFLIDNKITFPEELKKNKVKKGRPTVKQDAINKAHEAGIKINTRLNAHQINNIVQRKIDSNTTSLNKHIVENIKDSKWTITYDEYILDKLSSMFHVFPTNENLNNLIPSRNEFAPGGKYSMKLARQWVKENYVRTRYDDLTLFLNRILRMYKSRVRIQFKFKLWQDVLIKQQDGKYSILTLNIQDKTNHSTVGSYDHETIKTKVKTQLNNLLSYEDDKLNIQIAGSSFNVLLYSPIKLDIILVTKPEHGSSINSYIPIPKQYKNYYGILNINQDTDWSKDMCFLLCLGMYKYLKYNKHGINLEYKGGVEISASKVPMLKQFINSYKHYDHIDQYQKMIEDEFPYMIINIFMEDCGKPLVYKRFGDKIDCEKTDEVNLLLVGDLTNWYKTDMIERSHVFLLTDVNRFFTPLLSINSRNGGIYYVCKNCALGYTTKENHDKHYEECIIDNIKNIQYLTPKNPKRGYITVEEYNNNLNDGYDSGYRPDDRLNIDSEEYRKYGYEIEDGKYEKRLIDYKLCKYEYLMAADFETDTINENMKACQFGVAGSYYDNNFCYFTNENKNDISVTKIFKIAELMAYHNYNQQLYNGYLQYTIIINRIRSGLIVNNGNYDVNSPLSINDYYWIYDNAEEKLKQKFLTESDKLDKNSESYYKLMKKYENKIYHRSLDFNRLEIPLFFHNGIKFDNTLLFNNIDLSDGWNIGHTIAASATNFKQFEFSNKWKRIDIKVMDFMSFKQSSLANIVDGYNTSGKKFSIMSSLGFKKFEKIQFPYRVNQLEIDKRPVESIEVNDFIQINDNYSIYKTIGGSNMIFNQLDDSDYQIIVNNYEIVREIRKMLDEDEQFDVNEYEYYKIHMKNYKHDKTVDRFLYLTQLLSPDQIKYFACDTKETEFIDGVKRYKSISDDIKPDEKTLVKRRNEYIAAAKENNLVTISDVAWYYLKSDVYQLLECVRFYMNDIYNESRLNPFGYVSAHAHGFDWGLRDSLFTYDLLDDPMYYRKLKSKCYGGLSCTYIRTFNSDEKSHIFEFDATSMYPSSMCDGLPNSLDHSIFPNDNNKNSLLELFYDGHFNKNNNYIYFFHCDTSYDYRRYNEYWKFPPRITKRNFDGNGKITFDDDGYEKLTNDLYPSTDDIYEYEYLKFMVSKGLIVDNISRVDVYNKSYVLGDEFIKKVAHKRATIKKIQDFCDMYVNNNNPTDEEVINELREFECDDCEHELKTIKSNPSNCKTIYGMTSDSLKLTMNAFYGKTIENVENRSNNSITSKKDEIERLISSPLFISYNKLGDNYIEDDVDHPHYSSIYFIKRKKRRVLLDKPIFIGKTILDRSKLSLMRFVYDELFRVYGYDNVQIGGTDTDSVHVMITGYTREECYSKFDEFNCVIDNSKVPKGLKIGTYEREESHAGELGSWKNEGAGVDISRAVYHKSKQYCEEFSNGKVNSKSKGIPKFIVKKHGKDMFFNRDDKPINQFMVYKITKDHKRHEMIMTNVVKKVWGSEEDKVIRNNNGDYRPHGSKELIENAIKSGIVPDSMNWFADYMTFEIN